MTHDITRGPAPVPRCIELAATQLSWQPTATLEPLVAEMVAAEKEEARKKALLRLTGVQVVGSRE